jgi:hypothetical protein
MLKLWYAYQLQYLVTLFFIKISILAFYRRLSPVKGYQLAVRAVAGVVTAYTIVMVFVNVGFTSPAIETPVGMQIVLQSLT